MLTWPLAKTVFPERYNIFFIDKSNCDYFLFLYPYPESCFTEVLGISKVKMDSTSFKIFGQNFFLYLFWHFLITSSRLRWDWDSWSLRSAQLSCAEEKFFCSGEISYQSSDIFFIHVKNGWDYRSRKTINKALTTLSRSIVKAKKKSY